MQQRVKVGELVPVEDRAQWVLATRLVFAALVALMWQSGLTGDVRGGTYPWIWGLLCWPLLTVTTLVAGRMGRRVVRSLLTATMLGDGVVLAFGWWATGGLASPLSYLVILHGVAVTLLASFRTGVRIALWHSILALLVLEAAALGHLGPTQTYSSDRLWLYLCAMWIAVLGTASFAAQNERELRRRRYDSEVLYQLGVRVMAEPDGAGVAAELAAFARDELGARRAAVLAYTGEAGDTGATRMLAAVADGARDGEPVIHRMTATPQPRSVVSAAWAADGTVLRAHLDARVDPWLAEMMPQARALIVVPFQLAEVRGVLVMQMAQGTGWAPRVERRIVNTAEQATSQAGGALERAVLTERLRALSHYDGLTRVANRRHFDEFLAREVRHAGTAGAEVGLLLVDIDHFKQLNDTYGHQVGDEVLQQVALAIRGCCAEPHLVARYGGEEFAVVLIGTDPASALAAGEAVRRAVAEAGANLGVTASIGVASYPGHGLTPAELLAVADAALYRAKEGGRNQVQAGQATPPRKFGRMADGAQKAAAENGSGSRAAAR